MSLANEYEKLIKYLETHEPKKKTVPKTNIVKEQSKEQKASENTKKLLQEATIEDFADLPTVHINKGTQSNSFDITKFESMMRSKLIEDYKTRQSYERPYISVSELYECLRKNYYQRKRYQIDVKSQFGFSYLYLIQKVGNVIHEVFQDLYNFSEVEKSVVSEKYKVKGRLDALKNKTIFEIKSIDSSKFKGTYLKEHVFQGVIYAYILITEYDYDIENLTIIYVLRDLKNVYAFDIDIDMKLAESFLIRAPILLSALEQNSVPEPIGCTNEQCKWCQYKSYCEDDGYNKIIPPFLKKKKPKQKEKAVEKKEVKKKPEAKFLL